MTDTTPTTKPGWQTTEFYLSLAAKLLGALFASGLIGDGTPLARIAGLAAMVLTSLGYTVSRTMVKSAGVLLLVAMVGGGLQVGCAAARRNAVVAKDAVVLCTKADAGPILALIGELAADVVGTALHAGGIDWAALAEHAKTEGVTIGGCAFAALYKALEDREPATSMRTLVAQPDAARASLERLRAGLGGPRWQLADGSVL